MVAGVGEKDFEFGIGVWTGEADALHAKVDGHDDK